MRIRRPEFSLWIIELKKEEDLDRKVCYVGILFVWNFGFRFSRSQVYISDEAEDTWLTFKATCVKLLFDVDGYARSYVCTVRIFHSLKDAWRREHVGMRKAASYRVSGWALLVRALKE